VTIFNKLDENLSLTPSYAANPAIHSWAEYDYFCGGGNQMAMVGYALFQGYYSQENSSLAGKPMQLAPFVELPCATWPDPTSIVFLPHNDTAKVYGTGGGGIVEPISVPATTESCSTNGGTTNCGAGTGLFGYWNTSAPLNFQQAAVGSPFFRYLPLGEYTLAVQDVWNQTVYAHFQVVPMTRLECPSGQTAGYGFGTVTVSSSSPAIICVEVYYYSFSAITLNLTDALQVQAVQSNRTFSGDSNFIITPSQSQLVIGASSNVNEGTLVAFAVTVRRPEHVHARCPGAGGLRILRPSCGRRRATKLCAGYRRVLYLQHVVSRPDHSPRDTIWIGKRRPRLPDSRRDKFDQVICLTTIKASQRSAIGRNLVAIVAIAVVILGGLSRTRSGLKFAKGYR
jgi:hypothetical protein